MPPPPSVVSEMGHQPNELNGVSMDGSALRALSRMRRPGTIKDRSCSECRRRKQKCNQGSPCSNCSRRFPQPFCEYHKSSPRLLRLESAEAGQHPAEHVSFHQTVSRSVNAHHAPVIVSSETAQMIHLREVACSPVVPTPQALRSNYLLQKGWDEAHDKWLARRSELLTSYDHAYYPANMPSPVGANLESAEGTLPSMQQFLDSSIQRSVLPAKTRPPSSPSSVESKNWAAISDAGPTNVRLLERDPVLRRLNWSGIELTNKHRDSVDSKYLDMQEDVPEGQFTDSGYASGPAPTCPGDTQSAPKHIDASDFQAEPRGNLGNDTGTTYSDATTVAPVHARVYISELSNDIFGELGEKMEPHHWQTLSKILPDLIKAFAVRLGYENSAQVNRDVMYFIHKRHEKLTRHLKDLSVNAEDAASPQNYKRDSSGMSLDDKMRLWENKGAEVMPNLPDDELFEGVGDGDEDDNMSQGELLTYTRVVLNSSAYQWFVSSLRTECSLQWGSALSIRQTILRQLPSGTISKRKAPPEHSVTFQIQWAALDARLCRGCNQHQHQLAQSLRLAEIFTITCSSEEAQVATVEDYFKQTWPSSGTELLRVLQKVIDGPCGTSRWAILPDKSLVGASINIPTLSVYITGPAYTVAECGEQLAWLASAVRLPANDGRLSTAATPSIKNTSYHRSDIQNFRNEDCTEELEIPVRVPGSPVLIFEIEVRTSTLSAQNKPFWHEVLGDPVVPVAAQGFPTAQRPKQCSGLELPFEVLQNSVGAPCVSKADEFIGLEGSVVQLEMVARIGEVFYWKRLAAVDETISLGKKSSRHNTSNESNVRGDVVLAELRAGRHILCPGLKLPVSEKAKSVTSDLPSVDSLATDMLSILSNSEDIEYQGRNGAGFRFFNNVFRKLVEKFQTAMVDGEGPRNGSQPSKPTKRKERNTVPTQGTHKHKKRQRNDEEDSEDDNQEDERPPTRRLRTQTSDQLGRPRFLACPFWKSDPQAHWECFVKKLTTISYVKQHLARRHTPEFYCQRCFAVFQDAPSQDAHILTAGCTRGSATLDGISQHQSMRLSRKSKKGSVEEQWYAIWDIIFPQQPRPTSVYVDSDQSEDFCLFREFCQTEGPDVLLQELGSRGLLRFEFSRDQAVDILRPALHSMFEYYRLGGQGRSGEPHASERGVPNGRNAPMPVILDTPAASSEESVVALGSRHSSIGSQTGNMNGVRFPPPTVFAPQFPAEVEQRYAGGVQAASQDEHHWYSQRSGEEEHRGDTDDYFSQSSAQIADLDLLFANLIDHDAMPSEFM